MRRALVLADESFRHPFRQIAATLPGWRSPPPKPKRDPLSDRDFFLLSFVSGFIIFYGMIA
jgi:hypothetical protein